MFKFLYVLLFFLFPAVFSANESKVALLFLTVKDLNHSKIWKEQLTQNPDKFNVYIHSKKKLHNKYFKKYRIRNIVKTSWIKHVNALQALVREAVKDPDNKKFVFLSESCIPLRPVSEIYNSLIADEQSYIFYGKAWWPESAPREVLEIPKEHRYVSHEWVILNRKHAQLVAQDQDVIEKVALHDHDAESYIPSLLSYKGLLQDLDINNQMTTYTNWDAGGLHPRSFEIVSPENLELLHRARNQGYFFVRKIETTFPKDELRKIILNDYR